MTATPKRKGASSVKSTLSRHYSSANLERLMPFCTTLEMSELASFSRAWNYIRYTAQRSSNAFSTNSKPSSALIKLQSADPERSTSRARRSLCPVVAVSHNGAAVRPRSQKLQTFVLPFRLCSCLDFLPGGIYLVMVVPPLNGVKSLQFAQVRPLQNNFFKNCLCDVIENGKYS